MSHTFSVLHAITPAEVGGLESVIRLLARAQRTKGSQVHVVAAVPNANRCERMFAELRDAGVGVTTIVAPGRAYRREWRGFAAECARLKPDVVHTHGYHADLVAGGAARSLGLPTVTTLHGFVGGDWKARLYELVQRRTLGRFDAVVAVSSQMVNTIGGPRLGKRLHVIPNAYAQMAVSLPRGEARAQLGLRDEDFVVGWIGRMSREKGVDVFAQALAATPSDVQASLIGDGPERRHAEQLAASLGIADRARFHGTLRDAGRLIPAFDAIVLSSRTEGTPMVLLEAMAAGVPVVTTAVGGIPDVVGPEEALLAPSEQPRRIAEYIMTIRDDPRGAVTRAQRAADRLKRQFSVDAWADAYERVYATARAERFASR